MSNQPDTCQHKGCNEGPETTGRSLFTTEFGTFCAKHHNERQPKPRVKKGKKK